MRDNTRLPEIIGDCKITYLSGTIKIHKPQRPIIAQVPAPIYEPTKTINPLIIPFLPSKYSIKSTQELIQILHTHQPKKGILASLDVENPFTNVPVKETIDTIINNIYNNPSLPLKINLNILHKLLLDDVSMGSVLGLIFSNFYMSDLEN